MTNKDPRPGQRAVHKSSTGSYMAYSKDGIVRHGFGNKGSARAYSKKEAKLKALKSKQN